MSIVGAILFCYLDASTCFCRKEEKKVSVRFQASTQGHSVVRHVSLHVSTNLFFGTPNNGWVLPLKVRKERWYTHVKLKTMLASFFPLMVSH